MEERIREITAAMSTLSAEARAQFGGLSAEQLNWKPSAKRWSVGQCFDHLITMEHLYVPLFQQLARGPVRPSFWERYSPLSRFFGNYLITSLHPENLKKMQTSPKAYPSASDIDGNIIERYCAHQAGLIDHLRNLPTAIDPSQTIITSPLLGFVTYSLDDCFTILVVHGQRHADQARRVTETEGFPS